MTALDALIEALKRLPGVGQKSAQRMAYHLLQHDRDGAHKLAQALTAAEQIGHCQRCHTFSEAALCSICADNTRDARLLCVVETPADQAALERTGAYKGLYFVLMGKLSPLDNIGPHDIGLQKLFDRLGGTHMPALAAEFPLVQEVILATNFTAEGEATAHVIAQALRESGLQVTRLSRGVPVGSELEYVDLGTIAHALVDRRSTQG